MTTKQMSHIHITDLKFKTSIGVYEWEKQIKQTVSFDIDMPIVVNAEDDISGVIDYTAVSNVIETFLSEQHFDLLETMALKVAELVKKEFQVEQLQLKAHKPNALANANDVAIFVEV